MLTTYKDYGKKKSKLSYSSANNIHIHSAYYINFLNYKKETHSRPEISIQKKRWECISFDTTVY
jgi:hypothetical protein